MKNIFEFHPFSWDTTTKILGIFKAINIFLYANELTDGCQPPGSFRIGAGHQKDKSGIIQLVISPYSQFLRRINVLKVKMIMNAA
jgi:hypothetical protein